MADVLLDACCLINLFSTGRAAEILAGIPHTWHVCEAVSEEALFVDVVTPAGVERKPAELTELMSRRIVAACSPSSEREFSALVHYATLVDDGEAMCLALAKCRSWTVATDERKGRRIAVADGISVINTVQLIRAWAETQTVDPQVVRDVIERIAVLGRYKPGADVPSADWWRRNGGALS